MNDPPSQIYEILRLRLRMTSFFVIASPDLSGRSNPRHKIVKEGIPSRLEYLKGDV